MEFDITAAKRNTRRIISAASHPERCVPKQLWRANSQRFLSTETSHLDVFAVGASNHLWHWWTTTVPPTWNVQDLGGSLPAEAVSFGLSAGFLPSRLHRP